MELSVLHDLQTTTMENVHDVSGHGQSKGTPSKGVAFGGVPLGLHDPGILNSLLHL